MSKATRPPLNGAAFALKFLRQLHIYEICNRTVAHCLSAFRIARLRLTKSRQSLFIRHAFQQKFGTYNSKQVGHDVFQHYSTVGF